MNKETEQQLAELERIVTERQDWLFRFAYMRIGSREDAEDVVQEVLLGVFGRLRERTKVDSVEQYLIRSVSNACNDYFRRRSKETTKSMQLKLVSLDKAEQIPADEGDRQIHEEYLRINRLLDSLPQEQAEIVRLKCYDELTFKQIAELLNIPEPTAKSRYRYAIQHIQQMIKKGDKR
ncbi:MAG: sigma-70 family RNA polymerase sigma factor [Bacteroidales bacterium]|nr:sigma-70 family RNA polymerase sigma factor [Bacteroidales bacterium]